MTSGIERRHGDLIRSEFFPVIEKAQELFPGLLGERERQLYAELFADGSDMTPERLAYIQPEYSRFSPRDDIYPLIRGKEGRDMLSSDSHQAMVAFLGPSSGGKDSILDIVAANKAYIRLITTTTRPPRTEERLEARYHYVSPGEFARMEAAGEFAEVLPPDKQGQYRYGTSVQAVEQALQRNLPLIIWRGDIIGLPQMHDWMESYHSDIPFVPVFVNPVMKLPQLFRSQAEKRGVWQARAWRSPKSLGEIYLAAQLVDYLVVNPTDPSGEPRGAAAATLALFRYFESKLS